MNRLNPDLPVLCLPKIPHQLKMAVKKALRKQRGTSDGWRKAIDDLYDDTFDAEGNVK